MTTTNATPAQRPNLARVMEIAHAVAADLKGAEIEVMQNAMCEAVGPNIFYEFEEEIAEVLWSFQ
jgi:hypothetical protein